MYIKKILLAVILVGLLIAAAFAYMVYSTFFVPNTAFNNETAYVYVASDASILELKEQLQPLLKDVDAFETVADRKKYSSNIKGGKYALRKGMNNNDIVNTLRSQNLPVKVSFNNQETLADLAGRISAQIEADSLALLEAFNNADFLKESNLDDNTKLGVYLPNSYEFFWNTGATEFRDRMLKEYNRFWNDERLQKARTRGLKPMEVISLAAIVHKETAKVDERPRVAGLYLNRLKKNMLLQADPTVIYAIKRHTGDFDTVIKRVLYKDLELDSPYNTYKYAGVPPGPITMPDISAIDAVLNPENHDYLYMVANIENFGYHKFAESLAQHNRNKVQYVRWINQQKISR
ncbi:endolytic transglycosylase MltG [Muriicola sp. Z0-33]|uniref:endolytic transglycosylase MltG n=1 Tax=Muriicola sp. Z0-33 TaxID=2816957 RepID=UPI002238ECA5|nr:endolytic transglycosylase MltG [Muriicola sp. Z0-33]MCW5516516.1 endolytic transglycosylase MltG [Muriicola sp. Z0-33]